MPIDDRNGWDDHGPAVGRTQRLTIAAQALADRPAPAGCVPPARLREIAVRLASGFYDSSRVRDAMARRLASDVGLPLED